MTRATVITPEQIVANRQLLAEWVDAVGIDPHDVPDDQPITIRRLWLRGPVIRYRTFRRGDDGQVLIDPDGIKPWTDRTTVPCAMPLPKLLESAATEAQP